MQTIIIVAAGFDRAIGALNKLPWGRLSADMQHFKNETTNHAVVMGRKTFESFGGKPLPNRINIIITRNKEYKQPEDNSVFIVHSLIQAMSKAEDLTQEKVFIAGGGEIYRQAIEEKFFPIDKILYTEIDGNFVADTFFPVIDSRIWRFKILKEVHADQKNSFTFQIKEFTKYGL